EVRQLNKGGGPNMKSLRNTLAVLAGACLTAWGGAAVAAPTCFNLDTGNNAVDGYTSPYVQVCYTLTSSTTADFTFTSLTQTTSGTSYIYVMLDGSSADLNVNATSFSVGTVTGSQAGMTGFTAPIFTVENPPGTSNVNGFGAFNLVIDNFDSFSHAVDGISFTVTNT